MISDVIEERMCELLREQQQQEAENHRTMVNLLPDDVARLDQLAQSLSLSRADLGGRLLAAAIREAEFSYQQEQEQGAK